MDKVLDYLKKAKEAAEDKYEADLIESTVALIEKYRKETVPAPELAPEPEKPSATLQVLCMTPCSKCDKITPYLKSVKKLCEEKGIAYEYHRDNAYLVKAKKQYKPMGGSTPIFLLVYSDGTYKYKSTLASDRASEKAFMKFIEKFLED